MAHNYPWLDLQAATTLKLTANTTVATLHSLPTKYACAIRADIQVETAPIRVAFGGYTPAAGTGHRYDQLERFTLTGWDEMKHFRYIRGGATNAVIWVTLKSQKGTHPRG